MQIKFTYAHKHWLILFTLVNVSLNPWLQSTRIFFNKLSVEREREREKILYLHSYISDGFFFILGIPSFPRCALHSSFIEYVLFSWLRSMNFSVEISFQSHHNPYFKAGQQGSFMACFFNGLNSIARVWGNRERFP